MNIFTVENLSAGYGDEEIVKNVSFSLKEGCLLGILGANGSGKTTLLKGICGILPHQGSCRLNGTVLETLSPRKLSGLCSYIPQRSGISIDISVLDVVLMGFNPRLGLLECPGKEMEETAGKMLATVGLAGWEQENYLHLSEGQKQLCILARTLAADSRLLLLDEPESALDFRFRYRMLEILREWIGRKKSAAIVTLHDPMLAFNYCDELLLMEEGRLLGTLRPKEDSIEKMEGLLEQIYGRISLIMCSDRTGEKHLVMLKERESAGTWQTDGE